MIVSSDFDPKARRAPANGEILVGKLHFFRGQEKFSRKLQAANTLMYDLCDHISGFARATNKMKKETF